MRRGQDDFFFFHRIHRNLIRIFPWCWYSALSGLLECLRVMMSCQPWEGIWYAWGKGLVEYQNRERERIASGKGLDPTISLHITWVYCTAFVLTCTSSICTLCYYTFVCKLTLCVNSNTGVLLYVYNIHMIGRPNCMCTCIHTLYMYLCKCVENKFGQ